MFLKITTVRRFTNLQIANKTKSRKTSHLIGVIGRPFLQKRTQCFICVQKVTLSVNDLSNFLSDC